MRELFYGKDANPGILQGGSPLAQSDWIVVFLHSVFGESEILKYQTHENNIKAIYEQYCR